MRGKFIIILLLLVVGLLTALRAGTLSNGTGAEDVSIGYPEDVLFIGDHVLHIEVADTDEERTLGLGGRESIAEDAGMLFIFPEQDFQGIWMKGMRFPLDIIWLKEKAKDPDAPSNADGELVVVDLQENVAPETYPQAFYPKEAALYVLEVKGGAAQQNGIRIGSVLRRR